MYPQPMFHLFGYGINLYLIFFIGGILIGTVAACFLGKKRHFPVADVVDGAIIWVTSGFVGAFVINQLGRLLIRRPIRESWLMASLGKGGLTILGGIIFFTLTLLAYARFNPSIRNRALEMFDVAFTAGVLGQGIGKLGCFSAGCCHGKPAWGLPWAVTFTDPASACIYKGIPVHPTQLYEAGGDFLIFAMLLYLFNKESFRGKLIGIYFISYGSLRFVIEFFRGDVRPMLGALSFNQVLCIGFVIGGIIFLLRTCLKIWLRASHSPDGAIGIGVGGDWRMPHSSES